MSMRSGTATVARLPAIDVMLPRVRSVYENGLPILTVARRRHGSGQREFGGEPNVPIIVALSTGYQVERRTRIGLARTSPNIGAITIANPAERTVFTVEGDAIALQMLVSMRLIDEAADARVPFVRPLFNEPDTAIERSAIAALVALKDGDSHADLLLQSIAYRLAGILGRPTLSAPGCASLRHRLTGRAVRRVHELVQGRLAEPIPESPALAAGVSKHHFIKAFRETVGETPYAWVTRQRIERARALLAQPGRTVNDVALQTGFNSAAHFVAVFRQRLGITPGAFKQAILA